MKLVRIGFLAASLAAGAASSLAVQGCSQPVVPINAISAAETVSQTAAAVVADAQAVWPIIYPLIPVAQQPAAQAAFNKAVFAANHAVLALDDAIGAAIAADSPNPDFSALLSKVADAVAQVVAVVQSFQSQAPGAADKVRSAETGVDPVGDMQAAAARIRR